MKPSVHLAETLAEEAHKEQTYGGESYFKNILLVLQFRLLLIVYLKNMS